MTCRISCRINSLETHFEIYSPSIGVCKKVSISRNKRTNQSQQNKTKQTERGYAMRYGNVQRPRPTSNRRDRCYGAESLMFVRVSQRRDRPTKALQQKIFQALLPATSPTKHCSKKSSKHCSNKSSKQSCSKKSSDPFQYNAIQSNPFQANQINQINQ